MPTIEIDRLNINYDLKGSGLSVVLVHGHGGSSRFYGSLAGRLRNHYTVLTYDQRGYGLTDKPLDQPYSTELWAEDLYRLLTELSIKETVIGGHSMGGRVCAAFAASHPTMTTGLMMFNTTWFGSNPKAADEIERSIPKIEMEGMTGAPEFSRLDTGGKQRMLSNDPKSYALGAKAVARDFRDQTRDNILDKIECPTLILNGDRDSAPLEGAIKSYERIKNSRLAVIPGSGHYSLLEKEEICAAIIIDFLQDIN